LQLARFDILSKKDRILLSGALIDAVANSSINKKLLDQSVFEFIKKYNPSSKSLKFLDAVSYFLSGKSIYKTPTWRLLGGSGYVDEDDNSAASHFRKFIKIAKQDYSSQGYPVGGIQNITSCAINSFPNNKVTIKNKEKAVELITNNNKVAGVRSDKQIYHTDTIVYSGFIKDLPSITDSLSKKYISELDKIEQAKSFTLWLGLKKKLPALSYIGSEIYFDSDCPYWAMPTSNLDLGLAPKGKQLVGFTTIFDKDNYDVQLNSLKACIFKAIPDIRENIILEHIQTTIPEKAAVTTKAKFPSPKSPIQGLYLVGTDTDMRSMGVTRASFSVIEALKFMKEDGLF
jgi:phytoene dehydrogenase-like protein